MPEESINTFINNIVALAVFASIVIVIFLIFLLISRLSILRTRRRLLGEQQENKLVDYEKNFSKGQMEILSSKKMVDFKSDPFILKNILVIATAFVMLMLSIITVLLAYYIINNMVIGPVLFLFAGIFFSMFAGTVYIIKSKTLN